MAYKISDNKNCAKSHKVHYLLQQKHLLYYITVQIIYISYTFL